jgi:hypothetical protein
LGRTGRKNGERGGNHDKETMNGQSIKIKKNVNRMNYWQRVLDKHFKKNKEGR